MHLLQLKHVSFKKSLQNYSTIQIEKYINQAIFSSRPTSRNYIHSTDDYKNIKFCNKHWTFQYPITTPYCLSFSAVFIWELSTCMTVYYTHYATAQEQKQVALPVALSRSSRNERLSLSSTQTTFWVMFSEVEPTRPTAKKMYSSRKSRAKICKRHVCS